MTDLTPPETFKFTGAKFLDDIQKICTVIVRLSTSDSAMIFRQIVTLFPGLALLQAYVRAVIAAYSQNFREGAIVLRATSRSNDALNFRFYERRPVEVLRIAEDAELLAPNNPLATLLDAWSTPSIRSFLWGRQQQTPSPRQSCDFDPVRGLVKARASMGYMEHLFNLLRKGDVPKPIMAYEKLFNSLGLTDVRHVAVDFYSNTVDMYFAVDGPMTGDRATWFAAIAGYDYDLDAVERADQIDWLPRDCFPLAVTIDLATGEIKKVAWYALGLSMNNRPALGERLEKFLKEAPDYDVEPFIGVGWSFGPGQKKCIIVEKSYSGGVVDLMRGWKSPGI